MSLHYTQPTNQLHETESRWFAVRTRSKSEKFVQRILEKKDVEAYLPLQSIMRRYARTVRKVQKPLISCYIFVKIVKSQYLPILETENVAGFVRISKDLFAIPEEEILLLRRITLEDGLEIEAQEGKFGLGDAVEVSAGNLFGLKGHVVKAEGKRKVQVELEHIGYSLLITIDANFLMKTGLKI
jgi:transcriptional antiterminator RfaH